MNSSTRGSQKFRRWFRRWSCGEELCRTLNGTWMGKGREGTHANSGGWLKLNPGFQYWKMRRLFLGDIFFLQQDVARPFIVHIEQPEHLAEQGSRCRWCNDSGTSVCFFPTLISSFFLLQYELSCMKLCVPTLKHSWIDVLYSYGYHIRDCNCQISCIRALIVCRSVFFVFWNIFVPFRQPTVRSRRDFQAYTFLAVEHCLHKGSMEFQVPYERTERSPMSIARF